MKKYSNPVMDILLFDEEEDILTTSVVKNATYAADQLNEYMYNNIGVSSTTTIKIQDVQVKGSTN